MLYIYIVLLLYEKERRTPYARLTPSARRAPQAREFLHYRHARPPLVRRTPANSCIIVMHDRPAC